MSTIFLSFVNRAVTAGWLVLAVIILRLLLRRAPRRVHCLLWAAVAVRLVLPFSVESPASLIPTTQTVVPETVSAGHPVIQTGIPAVNSQITGYMGSHYYEGVTVPAGTAVHVSDALSVVWLTGAAVLLLYCVGTWLYMRSRLRTAVRLRDDLWQSEWVDSPFVLGLFRPRVYLPFRLDEDTLSQVEAHERAHIARGDHVWKVLAFALLTLHWFHPLLWAAYFLFCRDLEYACDERVIGELDSEGRKRYSDALLRCASPRRSVAPCPVAFGELGVGKRIKNVLRYKKPAFWVALIAAVALIAVAVCFLTDPPVKTGEQWLRTRRASNLGGCELVVNHGSGLTSYNTPLSEAQRRELARLLRSIPDNKLTAGGAQLSATSLEGWCLYFPKGMVSLSLPPNVSYTGLVLLVYGNEQTYIDSPELADWLRQLLPGEGVTWRCLYEGGQPLSSLTIQLALPFEELRIIHCIGSFPGGTPAVCQKGFITAGEVAVPSGQSAVWTPPTLDDGGRWADSFRFTWTNGFGGASQRSAEVHVWALPVYEGETITAVDYSLTLIAADVPLQFVLDGDTLTLETPYPVIDKIPFNDFYDSVRYDIDGDGVEEYCTLGMGPTSGLFTFTFAAQAGDQMKYASIFNTRWYNLSFVWEGSTLKVKGVTQSGGESYFDISVRDGAVVLSENGEELSYWGAPAFGG